MVGGSRKTRVLIVDDSPAVRQLLREIFASDPSIEVMGVASDPFLAAEKMKGEAPDVITLDVGMPRMDGITFLRKIMKQHPIPVVICARSDELDEATVKKAKEFGAADVVALPGHGGNGSDKETRTRILKAVKAAVPGMKHRTPANFPSVAPKLPADVMLPPPSPKAVIPVTERIVVVGASTGGTEALRVFLEAMPEDAPPIVIAQHMPGHFTPAFAERLNSLCRITVKEAASGDRVIRGRALIAPGDRHTLLVREGGHYLVEVRDGPLVSRHRPSVDVLFRSAALEAGKNAVGVIMTGMGDDGARSMKEMRDAGAYTIAQDEKSCVVFGMPAEAIRLGGVAAVLALDTIASAVIAECSREVSHIT